MNRREFLKMMAFFGVALNINPESLIPLEAQKIKKIMPSVFINGGKFEIVSFSESRNYIDLYSMDSYMNKQRIFTDREINIKLSVPSEENMNILMEAFEDGNYINFTLFDKINFKGLIKQIHVQIDSKMFFDLEIISKDYNLGRS